MTDPTVRWCFVRGDCRVYLVPAERRCAAIAALEAVARYWDIDTTEEERDAIDRRGEIGAELPEWMREIHGELVTFTDPRIER